MPSFLSPLANWVRTQPLLRRGARAAVRLIPDVPYTVKTREIGPIRIRLRRHRWLLWEKFAQNDQFTVAAFKRLIRPGDVAYDIGANIGLYTRIMHAWCGAGRIIAFEPMRENFELLQANIALGGGDMADRVRAFRIALSDAEGEEELQIDDMTSGTAVLSSVSGGAASVGRRDFGLPPITERVQVVTLDGFIERQKLPPPRMMKIDTEGAEVKVLRGASNTLKRHQPRLLVALHSESLAAETIALLTEFEYFCYGAARSSSSSSISEWRRLHAQDAPLLTNNNIVASCDEAEMKDEIKS